MGSPYQLKKTYQDVCSILVVEIQHEYICNNKHIIKNLKNLARSIT